MKTKGVGDAEDVKVGRSRLAPGMYRLSPDALEAFKLKIDGETCNLGTALDRLYGAEPEELDVWDDREFEGDIYISGNSEVKVEGDSHELRILSELLELTRKGVVPRYATWFLFLQGFDYDYFFVQYEGKIVDEHYYFYFELPQIFSKGCVIENTDSDSSWPLHCPDGTDEAFARYWYQRFYTETLTGQLMVLNPEEPPLYYYSKGRGTHNLTQKDARELIETFMLVFLGMFGCAVFLLAAIAIPNSLVRAVSLGIALACAFPLCWTWWQVYWKRGRGTDWMEWWLAYSHADTPTVEKPVNNVRGLNLISKPKKDDDRFRWWYIPFLILDLIFIIWLEMHL